MSNYKELKDIRLRDIELGNADGEKEAENKNFNDYFYNRHTDYKLIRYNYDKFIVTGKKGSGKTYLVKYLENNVRKDGILSKTIKWQDINLTTLVELGQLNKESEYDTFYKYIVLIEITRLILNINLSQLIKKQKNPVKIFKALKSKKRLEKFYKKRYPDGIYSIKKLKTKDTISGNVDINTSLKGLTDNKISCSNEKEKEYSQKNSFEIIEELEGLICNCLKFLQVILISDDLDEQELNTLSNEHFITFLIRYIYVVNDINTKIRKYNSKCIIVIRNDILEKLNYKSSNINKILTDSSILIDWCEKQNSYPWEYDIIKMLLNKVRISTNLNPKISDKDLYFYLFNKNIDRLTPIDYLLSRSLSRPRDIIVYLNKIIEKYGDFKHFHPRLFRTVLNDYSKYFISEFKNEMSIFYNYNFIEQTFNLLSDFNKSYFEFNDIKEYYEENITQYPEIKDLKKTISILYEIGLLGNSDEGAIYFSYRPDGKRKANYNAKFIVHYGAQKQLITKFNKNNTYKVK